MPERYCFIENCRSEFPQFLIPKDKIRRKKFLEILGDPNSCPVTSCRCSYQQARVSPLSCCSLVSVTPPKRFRHYQDYKWPHRWCPTWGSLLGGRCNAFPRFARVKMTTNSEKGSLLAEEKQVKKPSVKKKILESDQENEDEDDMEVDKSKDNSKNNCNCNKQLPRN